MHASTSASTTTSGLEARPPRTLVALERLLDLPVPELERLYRDARTPALGEVRGDLRGRMLAWPALAQRRAVGGALRSLAGSAWFPWRGKTFIPRDGAHGDGINRVLVDRVRLFPFETFIGRSRAGDFDALQLDYDLPENPPIIRSIKDEIRTIEPGVWLGQAWFVTPRTTFLWLYFGLAEV